MKLTGEQFLISFINNVSVRKKGRGRNYKTSKPIGIQCGKTNAGFAEYDETTGKAVAFQNAILYNAGVMIITVDSQGVIQSFNPEAEYELGYKADELVGKYSILIFHDPFEISKRAIELETELVQTVDAGIDILFKKALLGLHDDFECNYICKNGKRLPVLLNMTALRDERNNVFGFLGIAINISERKKAEENLLESLKKEKELNELKSRFVTMASHEFRTPLSTVLSSAYLIEKYPTTNDQAKREIHLQRIVSSVNMLSDILNDFLSLGKN
jgi:signal transduction histidine kinase